MSMLEAVVELRPDVEGLVRESKRGAKRAADAVEREMDGAGKEAGKKAGQEVGRGVEEGARKGARKAGDHIEREVGSGAQRASAKLTNIGNRMMTAGAVATVGMTLPMAMMGKAAAEAAIAYEDAQAANEVLWGARGKGAIDAWAKANADALNLSQTTVAEMSQGFSGYLTKLGEEGPAQLTKLMERIADSRSFYGGNVQDKMLAVSAAMRGEFDSLETAFPGVAMSVERVVQKANELYGINAKNSTELTDQQRIQATLALFYEQTAAAAGDVERTSDSTANKLEDARQKWQDLMLTLGTQLLPVVGELAPKFAELITKLQQQGVFDRLIPAIEKLATVLAKALEMFTAMPSGVQSAVMAMALFGGPVATMTGAVSRLIAMLTRGTAALRGFAAAQTVAGAGGAAGGAAGAGRMGGILRASPLAAGAGTTGAVAAGSLLAGWGIGTALNNLPKLWGSSHRISDNIAGRITGRYEDGGLHPGPRGRHSLAAVAGGELVLPTHKMGLRDALNHVGAPVGDTYATTINVYPPAGMDVRVLAAELDAMSRGQQARVTRTAVAAI
jgi:hypothetical protein